MTSNAGGRNDRPTLPPPFASRPAGAPPKSNPGIPLPAAPPSAAAGPSAPNPPSNPGIPLPTAGAPSGPASAPMRAGRQTQQPLPGSGLHDTTRPPPLGPPPPSQPIPLIPSVAGPASGRSHSPTQPPAMRGSGLHDTTRPPPLGPPPPSQPIPLVPGGPASGRSHSPTQPPSIRAHSTTQPPAMRGHDTTRPPPMSGPLGPPPPSQPYTPVQSMPPIMAAPPMSGPIAAPLGGSLGPPPPSQPYTPVESMPPIMATPPMSTPGQPMGPPGAGATQLGIPAAPTGSGGPAWGPGMGVEQPGFGFGGAPMAPSASSGAGVSPASFVAALRRAFRLRVDPATGPADLSPAEAAALDTAGILDPHHRGFLAWRRSVLLVVAVALVPITLLRLIHVLDADGLPGIIRVLQLVPVIALGAFSGLLFLQLGHWTRWQAQRRTLMLGFAGVFLAPFVAFLYPIDGAGSGPEAGLLNLAYTIHVVLVIGPMALALMPGLVRAALVSKLLFPGNAAPGWLVVLGAPLAALLAFVVFVVPYQLTGSGYFVLAIVGVAAAQLQLGRAGLRLARPSSQVDALSLVARTRPGYLLALAFGGMFAIVALSRLQMGGLAVTNAVLVLGVNVLVLTLIGADLVIANMERARNVSVDAQAAIAESQQRLTTFARESTPGTNVLR